MNTETTNDELVDALRDIEIPWSADRPLFIHIELALVLYRARSLLAKVDA